MYEKLCAILNALRECGIPCKAECVRSTGCWEIVCSVSCNNGMKIVRFPVSYKLLTRADTENLISYVMAGVCK